MAKAEEEQRSAEIQRNRDLRHREAGNRKRYFIGGRELLSKGVAGGVRLISDGGVETQSAVAVIPLALRRPHDGVFVYSLPKGCNALSCESANWVERFLPIRWIKISIPIPATIIAQVLGSGIAAWVRVIEEFVPVP